VTVALDEGGSISTPVLCNVLFEIKTCLLRTNAVAFRCPLMARVLGREQ
jgi:hypothetical protein